MGRYRKSFAYDHYSDEALAIALRGALAKRKALRLATMKAIAEMREEVRRRGVIPSAGPVRTEVER